MLTTVFSLWCYLSVGAAGWPPSLPDVFHCDILISPSKRGERMAAEGLLPQSGTRVHHGLGIVFKCNSSTDEVVSFSSPLHRPKGVGRILGFGGKRNLQKCILITIIIIIISATNVKVIVKYCNHLYDVILVPSV